jgi:hypothetical protein
VSSGVRRNEEGKKEGGSRVRVVQRPRDRARAPRVNERLRIRQSLQKSEVLFSRVRMDANRRKL